MRHCEPLTNNRTHLKQTENRIKFTKLYPTSMYNVYSHIYCFAQSQWLIHRPIENQKLIKRMPTRSFRLILWSKFTSTKSRCRHSMKSIREMTKNELFDSATASCVRTDRTVTLDTATNRHYKNFPAC